MKILGKDLKRGNAKIKVDQNDDLWYLSQIVDSGDYVSGSTVRKIKIGDSDDRKTQIVKKHVKLSINVEKVEFHKYMNTLRISGKVTQGPEDVSRGSYHTFNVDSGTIITIKKERWLNYQIKRLKDASEERRLNILICVFDRETASFAMLKNYGYDLLLEMSGNVQKKDSPEKMTGEGFWRQIAKQLLDYDDKYKLSKIIIASPAFWKDYLLKELEDNQVMKKIIKASCNATGTAGINEVMKRPEVESALRDEQIIEEVNIVEQVFSEISKDRNAAYGLEQVKKAAEAGAVDTVVISDDLIIKTRNEGCYGEVEAILKQVDSCSGKVEIISSEHNGGKKLDGIGGIAALTRYKGNF